MAQPVKKLSPSTSKKLAALKEKANTLDLSTPGAVSEADAKEMRSNVKAVLGAFTKVGDDLMPTAPVDNAVASVLKANAPAVQAQIAALKAAGEPTPLDYYQIVYKVMADSGLVHRALVEPGVMRRLVDRTIGVGGLGGVGGGVLSEGCDCGACGVCGACGACAACEISAAVATVGTVGTLGGAAAIGWLF